MAAPSPLVETPERRGDDPWLKASRPKSRWVDSPIRASSDKRLARRASKGDRRAIATIFERYQHELYGFCLGLLGEPQDAHDALQNTMVKILRALPGEEREIALRPWLYRIAHNEAIELRRSSPRTEILDGHLLDGQASVTERAEQREHLEWLLKDLGDLPERQRTVLVMREMNGLDFAEIGAALDTSGAVVRQSLYEARRNLGQMDRGRSLKCEAVTRVLSDADGRITRRRDIRAHLRDCPDCRRFRDAIGRREGVLSTIPVPAAAVAGVGQALLGGSSTTGTVAALTGGAAKSVGAYGVLKAAGTVAAVAVIGTAAIQSGMNGAASKPAPRHAHVLPQKSSRSLSPPQEAVHSAHAASSSDRAVRTADGVPSSRVDVRVSDRSPSSLPARLGFASGAVSRLADLPAETKLAAQPPPADLEPESGAGEGRGPRSKPEKTSPHKGGPEKSRGRGQQADKHSGPPPGQAKDKPEHPLHPSHSQKGKPASSGSPASQAGSEPVQPKTPPGQAKKQAQAEAQPPPSPPVETAPATAEEEAPSPDSGPTPTGKAKGHEK